MLKIGSSIHFPGMFVIRVLYFVTKKYWHIQNMYQVNPIDPAGVEYILFQEKNRPRVWLPMAWLLTPPGPPNSHVIDYTEKNKPLQVLKYHFF